MHYADGTPAQHGDLIVNKPSYGNTEVVGILIAASATSTTCNGTMIGLAQRPSEKSDLAGTTWTPINAPMWSVTLNECWKLAPLNELKSDLAEVSK